VPFAFLKDEVRTSVALVPLYAIGFAVFAEVALIRVTALLPRLR
jgi:hypothetical protein